MKAKVVWLIFAIAGAILMAKASAAGQKEVAFYVAPNGQKFDERIVVSVTGCFASYELFHALNKMREIGFQSVAVMPQGLAKHSLGELPTLNFCKADEAQRERLKNPQRGCPLLHLRHLDRPIIAV
jgi:hypothetical protein